MAEQGTGGRGGKRGEGEIGEAREGRDAPTTLWHGAPNVLIRPWAKDRAGCWVRERSSPPAVRVRGYYLREIFENSDAKCCILV